MTPRAERLACVGCCLLWVLTLVGIVLWAHGALDWSAGWTFPDYR